MNSPSLSPEPEARKAASELLCRRRARSALLDFTTYTFPGYQAEPAHGLIAETLDAVVKGEITRLMIFAPPQHGKSELASVRLPAYWLGKRPDDPVILSSYAASLAESKSRQARQIVESPEYRLLFPGVTTRRDSRAINHWEVQGGRGYLLAAGVGGPITGHGARLGIIDDPVENWQEAQSETVRDTCWDWWRTTFRTRIWEGGAIILIMTRWHEDDLAGRLLQDQPGQWTVLRLPALAETQGERNESSRLLGLPLDQPDPLGREPGEPLCPGRYSRSALEALSKDVGSMGWAGQYQGTPRAPEGNRFKRGWFPVVDAVPYQAQRVRYYDRAASEGEGDYTVGVLMARTDDGMYYVEDMVRGRWSAHQRDAIMKQTAERDALRYNNAVHIWVEQEPGSGGKESAQSAVRLLAGHPVHTDKVTGSKEVRAEPFASQAEAGNVRLLRGPWNGSWLDEIISFPQGAHDDVVDASSGAFNHLTGSRRYENVLSVLPVGRGRQGQLRIADCSREELADWTVEQRSLLLCVRDPGEEEIPEPQHLGDGLLDSLTLAFADLDPTAADFAGWAAPIEPYGLPAEQVMMTREHGKRLWGLLTRKREPWAEELIITDRGGGDRRALSLAYAICDVLRLPRAETILRLDDPDWKPGKDDLPPNSHVYTVTKESRYLVMGDVVIGSHRTTRAGAPSWGGWNPLPRW